MTFFSVLDIFLVALLIYFFYSLIRGTIAVNILVGYFLIYLGFLLVRALNMPLLTSLFSGFFKVGVIALIVVFQPEIRKFLLMVGKNFKLYRNRYWYQLFFKNQSRSLEIEHRQVLIILEACRSMQEKRIGALILFARNPEEEHFYKTGEEIGAQLSKRLIESIFTKESPLHDGAVIISEGRLMAAACILPLTDNQDLPLYMGLRHRAALGASEISDVAALVVSEETGRLAFASQGKIKSDLSLDDLEVLLHKELR